MTWILLDRILSGPVIDVGPAAHANVEVPEQVESVLEQLFGALQDRVRPRFRYSEGCLTVPF